MQLHGETSRWYAVQVRPKLECAISAALGSKGYTCFLPAYRAAHKPLLPGYVFCRLTPETNGRIVTTPGVIRIVGYGKTPAAVEEREIAALRLIVDSGVPATSSSRLQPGQTVRITNGPLAGLQGVLSEVNERLRFVVSVSILQRSVLVEMEPEWLTAVASPHISAGIWG